MKKFLGSGCSSTAYQVSEDKVHLYSYCEFKDLLSHKDFPIGDLFPKIIKIGVDVDPSRHLNIYEMPLYTVYESDDKYKSVLSAKDWDLYNRLWVLSDSGGIIGNTCPELREAAEYMDSNTYLSGIDMKPRNVGVDADGKLVLFDIFY